MEKSCGDSVEQLFALGVVIASDVPVGTQFGIDMMAYTTGPRFLGVKMVPKGLHFIYHSAVDSSTSASMNAAPRTGFFSFVGDKEALKCVWSKELERLEVSSIGDEDKQRIRDDLPNLDRYLGVYPKEQLKSWAKLTSDITQATLSRVQPSSGYVSSAPELQGVSGVMGKRGSKETSGATIHANSWEHLEPVEGSSFSFTVVPKRLLPDNCSAEDITKHSMDKTYTLNTLIQALPGGEEDLLGEFQLAFVSFLVGQVLDGFEQWKSIIHLLCSCDDAILQRPLLFTHFLRSLQEQLNQVPSDFFIDILSSNNFLVACLQGFFERLEEVDEMGFETEMERKHLFKQATLVDKLIQDRFGWNVRERPEDDEPVVVEGVKDLTADVDRMHC
eukprot:m.30410 g.30410  ORF g.30410 m.30410 type:complete len:388 (+) comp9638_c0_seq1:245-1408(+)